MPDQYPLPTWPDGMTPTDDQLREWLLAHERGHDARIAADMILGMYRDARNEAAMLRALLRHACAGKRRYRDAWLSARRRALLAPVRIVRMSNGARIRAARAGR